MTRTVPARFIAASNTASGSGASEPALARWSSDDRPARSTTTGLVRAAARSAERNRRASLTFST